MAKESKPDKAKDNRGSDESSWYEKHKTASEFSKRDAESRGSKNAGGYTNHRKGG